MGLPNWVQSGGQVQAPKITGFDTAFNPILGHLQRLVDANDRKKAAEDNRKFRQSEYQRNRDHSKALADASRISAKDMFDEELRIKSEIAQKEAEDRKNIRQDTSNYRDAVLAFDRDKHNDDYKLAKKKLEILENESNNTNKYSREAVAARDEKFLNTFSIHERKPVIKRYTGKTINVPVPEEELVESTRAIIKDKLGDDIYKVDADLRKELKDKYGISHYGELNKAINKNRILAKAGDAEAKKVLDDLVDKKKFFSNLSTVSNKIYEQLPNRRDEDEKVIDYAASLSQMTKEDQKAFQAIINSGVSNSTANRLLQQYKLHNLDMTNFLKQGAKTQQGYLSDLIKAEVDMASDKGKRTLNLKEFLEQQRIKYNAKSGIFKNPEKIQ